ncbi:MAG TPA: FKBP-type peptidyl-prolyl cis-trans isomerase, partial [Planctomycetaceae bacterium]|nr:FKBP-type peptidyl-prolyl cis-trans isomerase [Planctomycetaceae bacterium]
MRGFLRFGAGLMGVIACVAGCEAPPAANKGEPVPVAKSLNGGGSQSGAVDPDAPEEFSETPSGLKYRIRRKSEGRKPTAADSVRVDYKGWLDDGTEFDSSYKRGEPISFPLGGVIRGWTEGMQLVGEGGMVELEIPANLGYGARGIPGVIPPNSTLHFLV